MARPPKTPKYEEFNSFDNCFDLARKPESWEEVFGNNNPITLELGAGKAEFSIGLARKYKDKNFIAIDRKGDRLWKAAKNATKEKLTNVVFLRANMLDLQEYFQPNSVDEIWITFPDPYSKDRQAKHRMTNENFLKIYRKILKPDGFVNLKTDNTSLFDYTLEVLRSLKYIKIDITERNLHPSSLDEDLKILTFYEQKFMAVGHKIKYLKFHFIDT